MTTTDLEMKLLKTLPFAAEKMSVAQRLPNLLVCFFFGKLARAPDDDVLRGLTFVPGSLTPATERYVRKTKTTEAYLGKDSSPNEP